MSTKYTKVVIGSIQDVSQELYDELLTSGSSVLLSDVVKLMIINTKKYTAWSDELQPDSDDNGDATVRRRLVIDENTILSTSDWVIIEPVARAHCDLVQARRMEGAQGLGVQPIGMSSSEALQLYNDTVKNMQKEAFQCEPFSIETHQDADRYDIFSRFDISTDTASPQAQESMKGVAISKYGDNLITKKPDGLYAGVRKSSDTLGYASALDAALNKKD